LPKYQKKKARVSYLFFETNLEKNSLTPDNKRFSAKKRKKKNKKLLQSYTPCLESQSVKSEINTVNRTLFAETIGLVWVTKFSTKFQEISRTYFQWLRNEYNEIKNTLSGVPTQTKLYLVQQETLFCKLPKFYWNW